MTPRRRQVSTAIAQALGVAGTSSPGNAVSCAGLHVPARLARPATGHHHARRRGRAGGTLPQLLMVCVLGAGLVLPAGCRGSSPTGPSPLVTCNWSAVASPGSLTATLDGLPLAMDRVDVAYSAASFSISAVSDRAPACTIFSIMIRGDVVARGPATYTAGALVPEVSAVYTLQSPRGSWRADGLNGSGSLTVTRATLASVAGTFTFQMVADRGFPGTTATGTKVVTGAFDSAPGTR